MRKFIVNVNGTSYEVEVEEISGAAPAPKAQPRPLSKPLLLPPLLRPPVLRPSPLPCRAAF